MFKIEPLPGASVSVRKDGGLTINHWSIDCSNASPSDDVVGAILDHLRKIASAKPHGNVLTA